MWTRRLLLATLVAAAAMTLPRALPSPWSSALAASPSPWSSALAASPSLTVSSLR